MQINRVLIFKLIFLLVLPIPFFVAWLAFGCQAQIPAFASTLFSVIFILGNLSAGELYQKKLGEIRLEKGEKHSFTIDGPFDFERVRVNIRNRDFLIGFRDYFKKALDIIVRVNAGKQQLDEAKLSFIYRDRRATYSFESWMNKIEWYYPMNLNYMKYRNTLTISVESLRHRVDVEVWASRIWSEEKKARRTRNSVTRAR